MMVQATQRADDAERHVLGRILRFLARGRNRFEADVGEEDDRGSTQDSAPSELALLSGGRRDEGVPVGRVGGQVGKNNEAADQDKRDQHGHLDGNDRVVELGRFRHADDEKDREGAADQEGRQVEQIDDGGTVHENVNAVFLQMMASRPGKHRWDE